MKTSHHLLLAFGDVLDGSTKDGIVEASCLGEDLSGLIGKAKEVNVPQSGAVNFAKK